METPTPTIHSDDKRSSLELGEKAAHIHRTESEIEKDNGEVKLFADDTNSKNLKLASDGRTILIPQPSDDPRDPLNWSEWRKTCILLILAAAAFGGDFQSGAGIPLLGPQGVEWGMSPPDVNKAGNLNVLFLGIGGLLWIPPTYFWGRLPVLFWTQLIGCMMVLGSCLVTSFDQYYVLRPLTSVFLTAGQTIGLTFIRDMYCFHDHARKIGVWVFIFLCSPYCGPFFGGFMVNGLNGQWRPVLWLVFAYSCAVLLAIIFLAEETWYDRTLSEQPPKTGGLLGRVKDLVGITAFEQRSFKPNWKPSVLRLAEVFARPVSWFVFVIYGLSFMWAVGINITSSILFATPHEEGGYGFSLRTISLLYFTPFVGLFIGEVIGHWANDATAARYTRNHGGIFRPECRLYTFFYAAPLMIGGLVLVGQALQRQLNVGAIVIGWGMYVVGVMISSVSVTSYILDTFPSASGEVSALVNLARTLSGLVFSFEIGTQEFFTKSSILFSFSVGYFQLEWGLKSTFGVSFGIQAAIVGAATVLVLILVFIGERIRKIGGPLHYAYHH